MVTGPAAGYLEAVAAAGEELEALIRRGVAEVIGDQVAAGVDVPTDGEIRRENYIHYHCRHLDGIDFERIVEVDVRGGACHGYLPTVTGPVTARGRFLTDDWRLAQELTERPVKMTLPGPLTVSDTIADRHYGDPARLGADLARALNAEVRALAAAGCRHIQIDEPLFARMPRRALDHGLDNLARCFEGVGDGVTRVVHICCGYPDRLDQSDFQKAPRSSYLELAEALDGAEIDAVSLEDAHRPNDLGALLSRFRDTTVILGVVAVAQSEVEPVAAIRERLQEALAFIDAQRLMAAPDCGLGFLGRERAVAKLRNLCEAARSVG
jgi:5-methyltetrahydropteroyltriglutamate--homocysteine methyltransferase